MTLLTDGLSPAVLRTLALSLLHFLWQGAAIAALAYVVLAVFRSAGTRYAIAVAALIAMLLSPIATFFVIRAQATVVAQSTSAMEIPTTSAQVSLVPGKPASQASVQRESSPLPLMLFVEAWFAGVVLLSLRSIGGFVQIERLRRRKFACVPDDILELCLDLQDRMGISRMIRYCQSVHVDVPLVAGWIRPVVLLPISALTGLSQPQLEAVIAHELAHIRRYDAFVNVFQVAVETLLFYHPAVWWLGKRIRAEREHCCDDAAVAVCGSPVVYARALAHLAETRQSPRLAMALDGSPLVARVARLLGSSRSSESFRAASLSVGVLCLSVALLAGSAFVGSVRILHAQTPPHGPAAPSSPVAAARPALAPAAPDDAIIVRPRVPAAPTASAVPQVAPAPALAPAATPLATPTPALAPQADQPKQSYIDSLKDAGLTNLTVDELISLKIQGVTADYVKSMKELGMKAHPDELVALKIQGITPAYVKEMRAATGQNLDADALIGMKIQGVSPEYVRQMHDLGLKVDADDLVGMKIQGVTPEYVKEMRALGLKVDSDNLVAMKIQGVTPDYVKGINDLGLHPDTDELIGMKIQGVTPSYLKQLQAAGFKVDPDDAIAAKIQGITPEFIANARSHGFKDLTLDKLIALKHSGVLDAEK
jgi:beta-lactamase regulating signal transducer with metallopeptidase domain